MYISLGFIYLNIITMHGPINIKNVADVWTWKTEGSLAFFVYLLLGPEMTCCKKNSEKYRFAAAVLIFL
jgi:hypothetical protein